MGNHAMVAVVKGVTITAIAISVVAYMAKLPGFPAIGADHLLVDLTRVRRWYAFRCP